MSMIFLYSYKQKLAPDKLASSHMSRKNIVEYPAHACNHIQLNVFLRVQDEYVKQQEAMEKSLLSVSVIVCEIVPLNERKRERMYKWLNVRTGY